MDITIISSVDDSITSNWNNRGGFTILKLQNSTLKVLSMIVQVAHSREGSLPKIRFVVVTVPSNRSTLAPTDESGELDEEVEVAGEEGLDGVAESLADGHEGEE